MAGNVTVIVGNGLDISLGLKTSYKAFYSYVKEANLHPDNKIYKAISKENPEWWADFEIGLGRYTNQIEKITEGDRAEWSERLNDELDEIKHDLKAYVRLQNNDLDDEKIDATFFSKEALYSGLEVGQVNKIRSYIPDSNLAAVRFITLNYTNSLEKLFPRRDIHLSNKNYYIINPIHHIHGSITRMISLGVSDESQISSFIDSKEKDFLIKPRLIERRNDERLELLRGHIHAANVIVLFGLSIGASDAYIWEYVIKWLSSGDRVLIIHHYEDGLDVDELTERQAIRLDDRVKDKFLSYSNIDDNAMSSIKNRIYVVVNTKELFVHGADLEI